MAVSHFKDYRSGQEKRVVRSHEWMKTMGKILETGEVKVTYWKIMVQVEGLSWRVLSHDMLDVGF